MLACSDEFKSRNLSDQMRPKACILIKYTLLNYSEGKEVLWGNIEENQRKEIKNNLLSVLIYPNDQIRNTAADTISIIYEIEFESGAWEDLVPTLAKNSSNQDIEIKKSAIYCLGQICDKMKDKQITFSTGFLENILMAICVGMDDNEPENIKQISIKAFHDSLGFLQPMLQNKDFRSYCIKLLLKRLVDNSPDVIVTAVQCMMDYVKIYYDTLEECLENIWLNISQYINAVPEVAIPAIEVFTIIAQEDKERANEGGKSNAYQQKQFLDFTSKWDNGLVELLYKNLQDSSKYEDNEDGSLGIIASTRSCLVAIAGAVKNKFLDYNRDFVGKLILSTNILDKRAALIAYSCMLEGPSYENLEGLLTTALPIIAGFLANDNENPYVRIEAAFALEATAEWVPAVYLQETLFMELLQILTKSIEFPPQISIHIAKLWHFLGEELTKREAKIDLSVLIDTLLINAFRDDIAEIKDGFYLLIDHSLLAVMTLLRTIQSSQKQEEYVGKLVEALKNTGNIKGERQTLIQQGIFSCLQTLLYRMYFQHEPAMIAEIYDIIMQLFNAANDVTPDGIHVLGAIAVCLGQGFVKYSKQALPYIGRGLQNSSQAELFLASLGAVTEISRACPQEIAGNLPDILNLLMGLLNNQGFDKNIKLTIIVAIGDISLGCTDLMAPYAQGLMEIYQMAMTAAEVIPQAGQSDLQDYLEQLREHVLESFIAFMHSIGETSSRDVLLKNMQGIVNFLATTCTQQYNPTREYIKNALALVADLGYMFKGDVARFVKSDLTSNLIQVLSKFQNAEYEQIINYAKTIISKL